MPKLISVRGPTTGREYELGEDSILGRSPSCAIYIGDLTVSRHHARVRHLDGGYLLEDLGSGNGTYVNGNRVHTHLLKHDDEVRIADCAFRYVDGSQGITPWVTMVTILEESESGLLAIDTGWIEQAFEIAPDATPAILRADLERAYRTLETLYAVTQATTSVLEPQALFEKLLDYLLTRFAEADRGFIMLLNERKQLVPVAVRRRANGSSGGGLSVSQTIVDEVLHHGRAVLGSGPLVHPSPVNGPPGHKGPAPAATANTLPAPSGTRMCAPLTAHDKTVGILHIEGREGGVPFTQEDLDLLTGIARQAAVFILNAHMHKFLLQQRLLEQDLRFAQQVQRSFLPLEPPEIACYRFSRRYVPYFDVGGDFYDFIPLPNGQLAILIGDVSGKGVSAALLMARLTSDLRFLAHAEQAPSRVIARANRALCASIQDNMFATVAYLLLDTVHHTLRIANAGHIPPLLRRGDGSGVLELNQSTSLALGVLADAEFEESTVELTPGDCVLLCTDGVIEAKAPSGEEFGMQRLDRFFLHVDPLQPLEQLMAELGRFSGGEPQVDDLTMVAFSLLRDGVKGP